MSEWGLVHLGEIVNLYYGKGLKSDLRILGEVPAYSSAGITGWHNEPLVDSEGIIIGRKGSIGTVYYSNKPFWCIDTAYYLLPDESKYDIKFLYYLLKTLGLNDLNEDSAVPGLNRDTFYQQETPFTSDINEQKAIASVLSSLDNKIDLLHCQNKTLEAIAEVLFRQWFIEEKKQDWKEDSLSNIATFLNGLACQKYPPKSGVESLPVLKIRELSGGVTDSSDWATSDIKEAYIVEAGDVIFAWSASLMVKVWDGQKCVLNQHLFKVTSTQYPKWFYLLWCKYYLADFIALSESHATTMGHIKREDLDNAIVFIPHDDVIDEMSKTMSPLLDKQIANSKQIRNLENLRDALLPKLMSGEVRVAY